MNTSNTLSSTIKINLPTGIHLNAQSEAKRIGISVQDFIRMLMATYFANANSIKAVSRDQYLYNRAVEEINNGEYEVVKDAKELDVYFDRINS